MTKKASPAPKKTNRESDKFMLRMPHGMRDAIAYEAEKSGRSMNAEMVDRLTQSFERALDPEKMAQTLKRLAGTAEVLDNFFFGPENAELDAFIAGQREKGENLTRNEAIRLIVRTYLAEKGYLYPRDGASGDRNKK
jgi:hypothetical protein